MTSDAEIEEVKEKEKKIARVAAARAAQATDAEAAYAANDRMEAAAAAASPPPGENGDEDEDEDGDDDEEGKEEEEEEDSPIDTGKVRPVKWFSFGENNDSMFVVSQGSVVDFEGDAIVNAANEGGLGGGGVDGAINAVGGEALYQARKALPVTEYEVNG